MANPKAIQKIKEFHQKAKSTEMDVQSKNRVLMRYIKKVTASLRNGGYDPASELGKLYEEGEVLLKSIKGK